MGSPSTSTTPEPSPTSLASGCVIFSEIPGEFATVVIEPRRYAVFKHNGHVIGLHRSHYTIMNDWAPKNELAIASAPNFELYHQDFDPVTGLGTIEIWMPLDG